MKALVLSLLLMLSGCASLNQTQFDIQPPQLVPRQNLLAVLPELDDLTVGGLVCGVGVETSSHKYY